MINTKQEVADLLKAQGFTVTDSVTIMGALDVVIRSHVNRNVWCVVEFVDGKAKVYTKATRNLGYFRPVEPDYILPVDAGLIAGAIFLFVTETPDPDRMIHQVEQWISALGYTTNLDQGPTSYLDVLANNRRFVVEVLGPEEVGFSYDPEHGLSYGKTAPDRILPFEKGAIVELVQQLATGAYLGVEGSSPT